MHVLRGLIAVIFAAEGVTKLLGIAFQVTAFTKLWGYPLWLMYVIGAAELVGAVCIFIPRLRLLSNIGLLVIMAGAFYTHITRHDPKKMMMLAVLASVLLLVHLVIYCRPKKIAVPELSK